MRSGFDAFDRKIRFLGGISGCDECTCCSRSCADKAALDGLNGEVLGRYRRKQWPDGVWGWEMKETFAYFAGIRVARRDGATATSLSAWSAYRHDRLSSVGDGSTYLPYGEERSVTANDTHKFATYYRDSSSGLDYADQRYYSSTYGRFLTSDPYRASGGPSDPGSWNRYAYVQGDPVNFNDPRGY